MLSELNIANNTLLHTILYTYTVYTILHEAKNNITFLA